MPSNELEPPRKSDTFRECCRGVDLSKDRSTLRYDSPGAGLGAGLGLHLL